MRKCSLENLQALFAEIAKEAKLYLPVDNQDGTASFKEWSEGTALSEALNTTKSPKDFFFPQTEDLMAFKTEGKSIEVIDVREESKDFVIFGVRACDTKSFDILDRVFLTEPRDSFYATKREHGVIISLACTKYTCWEDFAIHLDKPLAAFIKPNAKKNSALCNKAGIKKQRKMIKRTRHVSFFCCKRAKNVLLDKIN